MAQRLPTTTATGLAAMRGVQFATLATHPALLAFNLISRWSNGTHAADRLEKICRLMI
jgi:hypothetical protein